MMGEIVMAIEAENVPNQVCLAKKQGRQNILLLFLSYIKVGIPARWSPMTMKM